MSVDEQDFAGVTGAAQAGRVQSFWPIIIGTRDVALLTEREINIAPCDAIWMPTVFDVSLGKNINQQPTSDPQAPIYMPDAGNVGAGPVAIVGANVCDVYQNGQLIQAAPVFSIRVNSPNNPWMLFGLTTQIATNNAGPQLTAGQGGAMRSLTGPISRLWVKFYKYAQWTTPLGVHVVSNGSNVVLMSSLGFHQETIERGQTWDVDSAAGPTMFASSTWSTSVASGGYVTPQLNSADKFILGVR